MRPPIKNFVPKEYPNGDITQFFGENPILYQRFGIKAHNGIDIVDAWDAPLFAVESGTIVSIKRDPNGYGRHIRLLGREDNGVCNLWTYGHCEQLLVTPGQKVKAGDVIGTMGNTGFVVSDATTQGFWGSHPKQTHPGTHLHLGLRRAVRDKNGFAYPGSEIKIRVLNYDNGFKGGIDPFPILTGSTSPVLGNDTIMTKEENLKTQISLLTKVVDLLKSMIQK